MTFVEIASFIGATGGLIAICKVLIDFFFSKQNIALQVEEVYGKLNKTLQDRIDALEQQVECWKVRWNDDKCERKNCARRIPNNSIDHEKNN
jgi:hypothetical protein